MMVLVHEIIHQLTLNKDALLALGALAAIASPFVALRIANKNLKGTLITNQRRGWIHEVRNEVAAVLAGLTQLMVDFRSEEQATRMIHLMSQLELTRAKLTLLMDPKNPAHCELLDAVLHGIKHAHEARERKAEAREAMDPQAPGAKEPDLLDPLVEADIDRLIDTTQKVLSEAWEKARSLK
jgi:hypothetical protein